MLVPAETGTGAMIPIPDPPHQAPWSQTGLGLGHGGFGVQPKEFGGNYQ